MEKLLKFMELSFLAHHNLVSCLKPSMQTERTFKLLYSQDTKLTCWRDKKTVSVISSQINRNLKPSKTNMTKTTIKNKEE